MSWRGRLSLYIRELRFYLSSGPAGNSPRRWLWYNYQELKTLNPNMPILVKTTGFNECSMTARYDFAQEKSFFISNNTESQINDKLRRLYEKGKTMPKSNESVRMEPKVIDAHDKKQLLWAISR